LQELLIDVRIKTHSSRYNFIYKLKVIESSPLDGNLADNVLCCYGNYEIDFTNLNLMDFLQIGSREDS